jgi:hypothetical protein
LPVTPDADLLARYADSADVPTMVALAIAAVESGYRGGNHWLGQRGEIGRMQIRPDVWQRAFRSQCGTKPLTDYSTNVCKGMFILRHWYDQTDRGRRPCDGTTDTAMPVGRIY